VTERLIQTGGERKTHEYRRRNKKRGGVRKKLNTYSKYQSEAIFRKDSDFFLENFLCRQTVWPLKLIFNLFNNLLKRPVANVIKVFASVIYGFS
jgi:hypothetical protein